MKKAIDSLQLLDALADEAARYEVEEGKPTRESRAAAARYRALIDERLAAMRRKDLEQLGDVHIEGREIRPDLKPLGRDALIARLLGYPKQGLAVAFAHRNLKDISDDDLRTMIQDIEASLGIAPPPEKETVS